MKSHLLKCKEIIFLMLKTYKMLTERLTDNVDQAWMQMSQKYFNHRSRQTE
jgi:hypothetical protein